MVFFDSIQGGLGLYLDTTADRVTDPRTVQEALNLLTKRIPGVCAPLPEFLASEQRIYRAVPHRAWLSDVTHNDSGAVLRDIRVEINLDELQNVAAVLDPL